METKKYGKMRIGDTFGRWKVIEEAGFYTPPCGKGRTRLWLCECQCDNKTRKIVRGTKLRNGTSSSCGCWNIECIKERTKKYNEYDLSGEYGIGYYRNKQGYFYFDLEDYDKIKNHCWFDDGNGYPRTNIVVSEQKIILTRMHELIFPVQNNFYIDHINQNKFDNRKINLRYCNPMQNAQNKSKPNKVVGVNYSKKLKKYRARIKNGNKDIHIGLYNTEKEAIVARLKMEKKLFGEFAGQKHLFDEYGV